MGSVLLAYALVMGLVFQRTMYSHLAGSIWLPNKAMKKLPATAAAVVDHIVPQKGYSLLFWNESNWQSLCRRCRNRKTATTDGRWG
jgi:5-methylcytosine-specific restriction endonuclease McrA